MTPAPLLLLFALNVQGSPLQVTLATDEPEAVLRILDARARSDGVSPRAWRRLFASEGYRRLARRETALGRTFSDSAFREFVLSDTLLARRDALKQTLAIWRHADIHPAGRQALDYLRPGTILSARIYLEIKPRTNSFVFFGDSLQPALFLHLNPEVGPEKFTNTLTHELHHIGYTAACNTPSGLAPRLAATLRWLGGFGEGLAMLAAAGGPDVHPHASSSPGTRIEWDDNVAASAQHFPDFERFYNRILDGQLVGDDSIFRAAESFYGAQGPFYTVGWLMWSTIERDQGRARVVTIECDPRAFLRTYNDIAGRRNAAGENLPRWSEAFLARLGGS